MSVSIFKQADGRYRWAAVSSSAYRDRDGEIVSQAALERWCAKAEQTGLHGPLQFWHVDGLNIGVCDFSAMHGPMLVESGTFLDESFGEALKEAPPLEVSIRFWAAGDGDPFTDIDIVERSILPAGAASNLFTAFMVATPEEDSMIPRKLEEWRKLFGGNPAADAVLEQAQAVAAIADAVGVERKEAGEPDAEAPATEVATEEPAGETPALDVAALASALAPAIGALVAQEVEAQISKALEGVVAGLTETRAKEAAALGTLASATEAIARKQSELQAQFEKQRTITAQLVGEQPRAQARGYRASEAGDTILTDTSRVKGAAPTADPMADIVNWMRSA